MSKPILNAVLCANQKFFPGLASALASAVYSASGNFDYHFHVISDEITNRQLDALRKELIYLSRKVHNNQVQVEISRPNFDFDKLNSLPKRRGSRMTFAKFLIPEIFPHLDSVVYMDSDVLYLKGIEQLVLNENEPYLIAGVTDYIRFLKNDCPWKSSLNANELPLPYVNAGVLWMNLHRLRKGNFSESAIRLRSAEKGMRKGDQPVWNYLCRGKVKVLSESLNFTTSLGSCASLMKNWSACNIHYIGPEKPWQVSHKTHKIFADTIWHQFVQSVIPSLELSKMILPLEEAHDYHTTLIKSYLYRLINPKRAFYYKKAVSSHNLRAKSFTF